MMAEESRRELEKERYEAILNGIEEGVMLLSRDFKILRANKALLGSLGLEESDVIGDYCYNVTHRLEEPCKPPYDTCSVREVLRTGSPPTGTHIHFDKDSNERFVGVTAPPIKDEKGEITEFAQVEPQLKQEIEKKTRRLQKAYDEYKALDKIKDDIISNVSHELRTPLTICKSTIELAMGEEVKEERNKLLSIGKEVLDRQNRIIGDLVDTAKIQRGAFELNLESLDLEQLITISKKEIEPLTLRNGIHIKTSVQENLPRINADIDKLKHVFFDFLDNAIKFNKKGGEINIEARRKDNQVEVSISDTGIGIAGDHLDKIFDRFYQVDGSIKRKYGGVGLGLAIARDIIKRHDGEIWVESEVGKGTKFTFTLPIHGSSPSSKTTELPGEFRKRFPSLAAIKGKKEDLL